MIHYWPAVSVGLTTLGSGLLTFGVCGILTLMFVRRG